MLAGSTLFLSVCTQRDYWPGGAWPLVDDEEARAIAELFALAARLHVREGAIVCRHDTPPAGIPPHCRAGDPGSALAPACVPAQSIVTVARGASAPLDRTRAYHLASGCASPIDDDPALRTAFEHLTAGIRDAVVFGAGVEYGIAYAVDALLRRRVRTHVALDAAAAADDVDAQGVIATWKRRGVDGATVATIARLLARVTP